MREIRQPALSSLTTLRLGGRAMRGLVLESEADFELLSEQLAADGGQALYLGHGSNILAADGDLPLTVVRLSLGRRIGFREQPDGTVLVDASADVPMPALLGACLKNGLSGLEGLVGIPGCVGGAVAMNAGSFGVETGRLLHHVRIYANGRWATVNHADLKIKYRSMEFGEGNGEVIVTNATFTLTKAPKNVIFTRMCHNFCEKKSRQPLESWSAGCAFKNPPQMAAGRLLEQAGFRGKRQGGVAFSQKHANFLINEGNGSASAALDLLKAARDAVFRDFGIKLETEVRIVPWPLS